MSQLGYHCKLCIVCIYFLMLDLSGVHYPLPASPFPSQQSKPFQALIQFYFFTIGSITYIYFIVNRKDKKFYKKFLLKNNYFQIQYISFFIFDKSFTKLKLQFGKPIYSKIICNTSSSFINSFLLFK